MIKIIRFLGSVILFLAGMIKLISTMLKFMLLVGIAMSVLMFTMIATFEALHFIQPMEQAGGYGIPMNDIFGKDIWAWVVAVIGWTTMIYGVQKMFAADKAETEKLNKVRESNATWLD